MPMVIGCFFNSTVKVKCWDRLYKAYSTRVHQMWEKETHPGSQLAVIESFSQATWSNLNWTSRNVWYMSEKAVRKWSTLYFRKIQLWQAKKVSVFIPWLPGYFRVTLSQRTSTSKLSHYRQRRYLLPSSLRLRLLRWVFHSICVIPDHP